MNNLENNMRIICIIFTKYDIIICMQLSYRHTAYGVTNLGRCIKPHHLDIRCIVD